LLITVPSNILRGLDQEEQVTVMVFVVILPSAQYAVIVTRYFKPAITESLVNVIETV